MNIKDFILGYLIGKQDGGGGSGVDVEPLTVTENGEYSEEGVAYSPVTVNVSGGGGASNIKTGTFTPKTENVGMIETLDTGYDGNGYPIAALIVVDGGPYNPANTDWYDLVQNKAVAMAKQEMASAPEYVSDKAFIMTYYKSTAANSFSANGSYEASFFGQGTPAGTQSTAFIKMSDKRTLKYNVANANYGFKDGIAYRYWIVYSE